MKEKWDKLKELSKNKYIRPLLFFGFYFIFFSIVLSIASPARNIGDDNNKNKDIWSQISDNYEYLYEIKTSDNQNISFEGKRYNNKNYMIKRSNGIKDNEIYVFYDEVKTKQDGEWISTSDYVFLDASFNEQYFDINYIKLLVNDSEKMDTVTNFDDTKSEFYKFNNVNIEVVSEDNILKRVLISDPLYRLVMQYKNINNVEDFVVEN